MGAIEMKLNKDFFSQFQNHTQYILYKKDFQWIKNREHIFKNQ